MPQQGGFQYRPERLEILQGGKIKRAMARKEVILSSGAIFSPQLLQLSGIGPGGHLQQWERRSSSTCPASARPSETSGCGCKGQNDETRLDERRPYQPQQRYFSLNSDTWYEQRQTFLNGAPATALSDTNFAL